MMPRRNHQQDDDSTIDDLSSSSSSTQAVSLMSTNGNSDYTSKVIQKMKKSIFSLRWKKHGEQKSTVVAANGDEEEIYNNEEEICDNCNGEDLIIPQLYNKNKHALGEKISFHYFRSFFGFDNNIFSVSQQYSDFQNDNDDGDGDDIGTNGNTNNIGNHHDTKQTIHLLKFLFSTQASIAIFHYIIRYMKWENDVDYTIYSFVLYDLHHVTLDSTVFYTIGRLYHIHDNHHLYPCLLLSLFCLSCIFASLSNEVWFLRHSLSVYEVMCNWPWQLFCYVFVLSFGIAALITKHVKYAMQTKTLQQRLLEVTATIILFLPLPVVKHPNFHLHHWFGMFLIGMHTNINKWWSRCAQFICWGIYVNGIAAYGRDPILTCAYAYYISTDGNCSFMKCNYVPPPLPPLPSPPLPPIDTNITNKMELFDNINNGYDEKWKNDNSVGKEHAVNNNSLVGTVHIDGTSFDDDSSADIKNTSDDDGENAKGYYHVFQMPNWRNCSARGNYIP
mmetsp:Transcript_1983/g.2823  ORF Transcript_1983/g.2823 Transcript_1983/m.2823 type:complete len:502 (+) Transcript_1983:125-1630(+)